MSENEKAPVREREATICRVNDLPKNEIKVLEKKFGDNLGEYVLRISKNSLKRIKVSM